MKKNAGTSGNIESKTQYFVLTTWCRLLFKIRSFLWVSPICVFGSVETRFLAFQTYCLHVCLVWKFHLMCSAGWLTVLSAHYTQHYAHNINTSEGKLFLDVPRTWKQPKIHSGDGDPSGNSHYRKHTLTFTGVWHFLSFSFSFDSLVTTRSEMSIFWGFEFISMWKKTNENQIESESCESL